MIAFGETPTMTMEAFLHWEPPERADHRWHLVEGEPVCMPPGSVDHGALLAQATMLIGNHLQAGQSECRAIVFPAIVPRISASLNLRVPDLGVTCAPPRGEHVVSNAVLLLEILSPSNEQVVRSNVWTYATIPSVTEILLLHSTRIEAEILRRDAAGAWPEAPEVISGDGELHLASIDFQVKLSDLYATTSMAR